MAKPKLTKAETGAQRRQLNRLNQLAAPEPKDKLSDDWRYWKIAQTDHAFFSGSVDPDAYGRAWAEFRSLLLGLIEDGDFWHVSYATKLLPTLLIARQEIDEMHERDKRMRAAMKGWKTRRRRAAIRDGFDGRFGM